MAPRKSLKTAEASEAAAGKAPVAEAAEAPVKARTPRTRTIKAPAEPKATTAKATAAKATARKPRASKAKPAPEAPVAADAVEPLETAGTLETTGALAASAPAESPAQAASALLTPHAATILEAIQAGAAVELIFCDTDANPPRTFEPRQLVFDALAKGWYVWGWDRRYNAERHHRLDLVAQVSPVEGMGRAAQGPYKEGTAANQVGGWLGGEPIHVRAILLKQWIFAVRQAPAPFPEFRMEDVEEGKGQVSFVGTDLRAIARWVMQFGDGIQVLEPQRLMDRIKQVGIAWAGKPVQERPAPAPQPARPQPQPRGPRPEKAPAETRAEPREPAQDRRRPEPPAKPARPGKIEIRIDRL